MHTPSGKDMNMQGFEATIDRHITSFTMSFLGPTCWVVGQSSWERQKVQERLNSDLGDDNLFRWFWHEALFSSHFFEQFDSRSLLAMCRRVEHFLLDKTHKTIWKSSHLKIEGNYLTSFMTLYVACSSCHRTVHAIGKLAAKKLIYWLQYIAACLWGAEDNWSIKWYGNDVLIMCSLDQRTKLILMVGCGNFI